MNAKQRWERDNKSQRRRSNLRFTRKQAALVRALKNKPCADCGGRWPAPVMQFDHVRGVKAFNISNARKFSTTRIQAEAEKCEVVCANCHALRTHKNIPASSSVAEQAPDKG